MRTRYFSAFLATVFLAFAGTVNAQNREVSGTTDANGIYVQQGTNINGKAHYQIGGAPGLTIYWCDETTFYNNSATAPNSCSTGDPSTGFWVIASQPYAGISTSTNTLLYYVIASDAATAPPTGMYSSLNGASSSANVTNTALPVELTSFESVVAGREVSLVWTTASETNNAGFSVEMKTGEAFVEKGFVAGKGTTLEAQRYSFEMGTLTPGTYTFRLRQVDFDGAFEYSPEVEVAVALDASLYFSAPRPNPMRAQSHIEVSVQQTQPLSVNVYDLLGREVATLFDGTMSAGEIRTLTLERGELPAGLYLVQLRGSQVQSTRQITLL